MKMNKIQFAAAVCLLAIACNKEIPANPGQEGKLVEKTFTATYAMSDDADSKVAIDNIAENKANLKWQENDAIKVFAFNDNNYGQATAANLSDASANFTVRVPNSSDNYYYAVYPASAVDNSWISYVKDQDTYYALTVTIPHEQTAVHDSFDPNAYIATAKAESNNNSLIFQPVVSAFCFHFEKENEPGKIKSIKFETGVSSALAIAGTFVCYSKTFQSASWLGGTSVKQTSVTLNAPTDGFKKGATYYVVVRPSEYKDGMTFTFNYEDGTTKTATYKNSINIAKGKIKNLGDLSARVTLFNAYNEGGEVKIGDITLNKNQGGPEAVKIEGSTDKAAPTDITSSIVAGKVYFISGYCRISSGKAIDKSTYLVANSDDATIEFTDKAFFNHAKGDLGFKGITIKGSGTNYLICNSNATADTDNIIFDGCKVETSKSIFARNNKDYTPLNIYVVDTDVQLTGNAINVFNLFNSSNTSNTQPSVTIENSIFHKTESTSYTTRIVQANNVNTIEFTNNTIYNLCPTIGGGIFHTNNGTISKINMKNCLFSFGTLAGTSYIYNINSASNVSAENCYYSYSGGTNNYTVALYKGASSLTNTENLCTKNYPYASNYPGCGAQR